MDAGSLTMTASATPGIETTPPSGPRRPLTVLLTVIIAVAALAIAGTAGWFLGGGNSASSSSVSESSVDAGFARDMSTHHTQAVTMANYERDNSTDSAMKVLAYDIETSQQFQIGEMQGWLDAWGLSRESSRPEMAWLGGQMHMAADHLMPGMATPAQMNTLESSHGRALDVLFLQLMIHHHQGGLPMARYAISHAETSYVRDLAQAMYSAQGAEIVDMERLLRTLGSVPLPPPDA